MNKYLMCIGWILTMVACKQATVKDQAGTPPSVSQEELFTDDTMPTMDTLPIILPLDEEIQLRLFREVLKDVKTKKLYDFSALGNDRLLSAYTNFQKIFNSYGDSTDERYTEFFKSLFYKMELHEQDISNPETPDIRTRLEIARIKSDINAGFADKKSRELQK